MLYFIATRWHKENSTYFPLIKETIRQTLRGRCRVFFWPCSTEQQIQTTSANTTLLIGELIAQCWESYGPTAQHMHNTLNKLTLTNKLSTH